MASLNIAPITALLDFDELNIAIHGRMDSGILISGRAELEGDADDFYVTAVFLEDGSCLSHDSSDETPFETELFKRIVNVIHNDKTVIGRYAAIEWADAVEQHKQLV
ncbi:hypothetical protein HGO37_26205 [Rhizobium sp. CG4]|jgi:hypothetical protein|uniref:hypothetical protein n=1 Tax=Rhizobium sp. CG4 TaxID=2726075 RepID=UPI002033305D|nr:hypothetical protein [Rhizobium sp. CG4]MCM2458878.1 hypothetical protein [Rhizobium sp. CG4]